MGSQQVTTAENSKNQLDFTENIAKNKNKRDGWVARGAGFEPAELGEKVDWT